MSIRTFAATASAVALAGFALSACETSNDNGASAGTPANASATSNTNDTTRGAQSGDTTSNSNTPKTPPPDSTTPH